MAGERLAIAGGDAAGMSAAAFARRRDPDIAIVAFERGPYTSYSACGIPYYIGRDFTDSERLIVRSPEQHRERGIDVRIRHEVVAIDLAARRLTVRAGSTASTPGTCGPTARAPVAMTRRSNGSSRSARSL